MSLNSRYAKVYELERRISRWLDEPFGWRIFFNMHLDHRFTSAFNRDLELAHKRVFPRRRIIKVNNLPEDVVEEIRQKWHDIALVYIEDRTYTMVRLRRFMRENANKIDLSPQAEESVIDDCDTTAYNSQGSGKYKYARAPLEIKQQILLANGFTARIDEQPWSDGKGIYKYILMSNAARYQLDAIQRMGFDMTEWAADCWRKGVNPKVYIPTLDDKVYSDSLVAAGYSPL